MIDKKRVTLYFVCGIVALIIAFLVCMAFGSTGADISLALKALTERNYDNSDLRIFLFVRFPRCLGAILSGSALAVSGVLIQAILNNPMASPNIIGVNSGAGFAVILTVAIFPNFMSIIPAVAFLGAMVACIIIYAISNITGAGRITITLVGIAVTSILNAALNAVKTFFPNSVYNFTSFSVGGLAGINMHILLRAMPIILLCLFIAIIASRNADIICLGEDTALNLGMNVKFWKFIFLIVASALAGCAVSFAGLLGFVGLVVPHIVRIFVGNKHILLIPLSAIFGAVFVLLCDLFCRVVFRPYEIPVGIVLSLAGGIFFVCLILFHRKGSIYD